MISPSEVDDFWIMIGAKDDNDAWKQAKRSSDGAKRETLQKWNGTCYQNVTKMD